MHLLLKFAPFQVRPTLPDLPTPRTLQIQSPTTMAGSGSKPRKRRRRTTTQPPPPPSASPAGPDCLSNLSDDLLLLILHRLPTRLAASFSLLSRRFRHLPSLLPRLDSLDPTTPSLPLPTTSPLLLRRLSLSPSLCLPPSSFPSLLSTASSHGVSELSIRLQGRNRIPSNTLALKSLLVLSLSNCTVPRAAPIGCLRLRTLKLERVAIHQHVLTAVLAATRALETLHLIYCTGFGVENVTVEADRLRNFVLRPALELQGVVVNAPRIRMVTLYTRPKMRRLQLAPAPEVRKAYLHVANPRCTLGCQLRPFLEAGTGLVCLVLRGAGIKFLSSECQEIQKLAVSFQDLRILSVSLDFSSESEVVFLLKLLESCPSIRELNLSAAEARKENPSPTFSEHKKRLEKIHCLTRHLKQFKLLGFKREPYEQELVRFLLTQAKKLKKMMLEFRKTQMDAVKEILSVRKAPIERTSTYQNSYRVQLEFS